VLISQDEIFTTNEFFKKILIREQVKNLKVYTSISDFLKDFGPKLDFITNEKLLAQIDDEVIRAELLNDIRCFPSYVSQYYYEKTDKEVPDIETLEIKKIEVHDHYVVKDYKKDLLKVNISVRVDIKATFQPEAQKEELEGYLNSLTQRRYSKHQNHFDKEGRPVFENGVLFIFEGTVDVEQKKVENVIFIDFIPNFFIIEQISQQLSNQKSLEEVNPCAHEFDTNDGFWRNSKYGGGLSWHYRCKKCGAEYDTGDFFD
jgi:hypothetical protein